MPCQQCCVKGDVIGGVVSVATGTFDMVNHQCRHCSISKLSAQVDLDVRFEVVDALAVCPDVELVVRPLRQRTRRTNRGVRNIRSLVPRLKARQARRRRRFGG